MKRILLLALVAVFSCAASFAQSKNFWSGVPHERAKTLGEIKENFEGITENLFHIDTEGLKIALADAPDRGSAAQGVLITIPNLDGKMEHFRVFEASNFEPELQVDIYYRMRDEVKFASVAELKAQLEEDMKLSLDYIKNKLT